MAAAIRLSRWNTGRTSTNPSVGCLVVRDGVIVGRAVTAKGGRPHAETQALAEAGVLAQGATAYVTLEPCSHHGHTPPCSEALIAAGVARVVVSVTDPDSRVSGRGLAMLRDAGIDVETGVLEKEGRAALAGYLMRQIKNRPHVTLKLAISADGMIGRLGQGQVAITGSIARAQVHVLRAETDAILVGGNTARADDPELTSRLPGLEDRSPIRIVLDPRLELPLDGKLVSSAKTVPVLAVADEEDLAAEAVPGGFAFRRSTLDGAGVEVLGCDPRNLGSLLSALASRGISTLMVEGGAATARSFLDAGLVDRILLFRGPGEIGGTGIESPLTNANIPAQYVHVRTDRYGEDICEEFERGI
ncbi:bifunctional diaminohydroxyphosphoribosylaminopyrimidine deaminase/5-amino-6-(5-phosphoribosylamino)uracil reductase RibD [Rhizobiaceae bacterium n13]|uniref:Riboflavin biosynthesis protein RibD n=2 Tax=Ferirhizobium litorale TaxID=2927786 RepID=A0AAE3QA43_9HYPH|nr:bifunctional diaminohydroxyphosphoribosylaminopyrimidine deaminase/5-amino-6-(5-phosphoribosylamino)uracil reductase RibD [Fererhizobium litorale]MDI7921175.1 bifunctional diaminohydroxyphosphoribosylaminopyrimidine deaminase/5-amino-6-(5-phosphoribosylamino)uracil reductase RibD [Fererhizobium litorale]